MMRVAQMALPRVLGATLALALLCRALWAQEAGQSNLDVGQLFATTCGWCHSDGGRTAGKGPQLMDTKRSDDFIRYRIKRGKEGAMPAFGATLTDADIDKIIVYIHSLKPSDS